MEKHNTVHAIFASGAKTAEIIDDVWQYDFGQTLQISGLSLPPTIEIHYANKGRDTAIPQVGVTKDGITTAPIPKEILSEKGSFTAYIFVTNGESGETCYTINGYVNKRPPVEGFNTPEDQEILHAAVGAVNAAAERAESAETKATEAANQTAEDAKQTAADRAETERLVESVSGIGEQVIKVENLTKQAQTSATNAALSEQAAKTAETNAQTAQAGAETAEGNAELAERNVKASERVVEKAKQLVTQMGQEVLDNKNYVDQTVQAFDQTAQQAVADVNNAGQTQTERVQSAGNDAVESVKAEQGKATQAIETAKTEAVKAVQTEGTTQTGNVAAEGEKQVQAVQAAAQEIVADREQIAQNKADIADIREEMDNLSSAIINSATGEAIVVEDSSSNKFRGLSIYGKSEQVQTTGAQLYSGPVMEFPGAVSGTGFVYATEYLLNIIKNIPNGTYSVSYKPKGNGTPGSDVGKIALQDAGGNMIVNPNKNFELTDDVKNKVEKVALYGYIGNTSTIDNFMLNAGSTAKPYEPYTGGKPSPSVEYPQEITSSGDKGDVGVDVYGGNLFDIDAEPFEGRRNDYIFENNAIYKDNIIPYKAIRYYIKVPPKTRLRLSVDVISNSTTVQVSNYKEGGTTVNASIRKPNRETIFDTNEHEKLVVSFYNFEEGMLKAGNIMVGIAGEAKTIFEPYKPAQTLTIPTPTSLPGIKVDSGGNYTDASGQQWVCDEIDLERGKYVQRIYSCRKEDCSIVKWSNGEYFVICYEVPTPSVKEKAVCSATNIISHSWINGAKPHYFLQTNGQKVIIALGVDYCFSETEMRKILDRGIEFIYVIETPIEHDLPPEVIEAYKKLHTNYPVTTVLNDAGAGMKVEYVADTKNYTDNKIAESVKNQMQNLTNLLSLMPMETQAAMIENDVNRILESEVTK
nr:MAG TPA: hypothetical protein [Caudoviricetes sp.]